MENSETCLEEDTLIDIGQKADSYCFSQVTEIIASHDNEIELQMVHQVVSKLKMER